MYGTQAQATAGHPVRQFENDVKMYGTQAEEHIIGGKNMFENDVKMYGTQAYMSIATMIIGLRMM